VRSRLSTGPDGDDHPGMHTVRSLLSAPEENGADPFAIYDQLPPVKTPTVWRRAFPTLAQLATTMRHHDDRSAAA
jgi:hypothetical protein